MNDETIVNDILKGKKLELLEYQNVIADTESMSMRNALQQIRNTTESLQYELFKIAKTKGYYKTSDSADDKQINQIKNELK